MTLSQIMISAWTIHRARSVSQDFRTSLRMAWGIAKGFGFCFQVSYVDADYRVSRTMGFGRSYDEVRAATNAEIHSRIKQGFKPLGANSSNIGIYAPAVAVEAVQPVALKRAA